MKLRDGHCDTLGPPFLGHRVTQCLTQGYTVKLLCETFVSKFFTTRSHKVLRKVFLLQTLIAVKTNHNKRFDKFEPKKCPLSHY